MTGKVFRVRVRPPRPLRIYQQSDDLNNRVEPKNLSEQRNYVMFAILRRVVLAAVIVGLVSFVSAKSASAGGYGGYGGYSGGYGGYAPTYRSNYSYAPRYNYVPSYQPTYSTPAYVPSYRYAPACH